MFDIYYNGSCVCGGYETDDRAAHVADMIIKQNNGEILAAGHDGNNWWWVVRSTMQIALQNTNVSASAKIVNKTLDKLPKV